MSLSQLELSIVLPCLNEEKTVGVCIQKAQGFLEKYNVPGEVIIADNGSSDRSVEIAESLEAHVVNVTERGYGNALRGGFATAKGIFILMADADDSYDLENLIPFLEKLRDGYDLVMGNRFKGGIKPGAMPWHHQYIGNPILSFIGRLFFHSPAKDFHCGIRAIRKDAIERMNLQTTGMELASEIVIKASILGMKVCEVPTKSISRWARRAATSTQFPRWLATPTVSLAIQPRMVILIPRYVSGHCRRVTLNFPFLWSCRNWISIY